MIIMASGPNWNAQRGTWYVQYWDLKWRRKTVAKKRPGWKPGDPPPEEPPAIAYAEMEKLEAVEAAARLREGKDDEPWAEDEADEGIVVPMAVVFRDAFWTVFETFLVWSQEKGHRRIDELTPEIFETWLKDQFLGLLVEERSPWDERLPKTSKTP